MRVRPEAFGKKYNRSLSIPRMAINKMTGPDCAVMCNFTISELVGTGKFLILL